MILISSNTLFLLVYNIIRFICLTLYFSLYILNSMLNTKSLVSKHYHRFDPVTHFTLPSCSSPSSNHYSALCFVVWFAHLLIFVFHPCCCKREDFIFLNGTHIPHLLYLFIYRQALSVFSYFGYWKKCCGNIRVPIYFD